jgi:hypothetical protein
MFTFIAIALATIPIEMNPDLKKRIGFILPILLSRSRGMMNTPRLAARFLGVAIPGLARRSRGGALIPRGLPRGHSFNVWMHGFGPMDLIHTKYHPLSDPNSVPYLGMLVLGYQHSCS